MRALSTDFTIATPAFPDNKRRVFKGYLFADETLLNESGIQNHPLTPMTDANLVRVLQTQTQRVVGLIDYTVMARGAGTVQERIQELKAAGMAVVDAISNNDLMRLGPALKGMPHVTAGSSVVISLPQNFGIVQSSVLPKAADLQAVVCGMAAQWHSSHTPALICIKPMNWSGLGSIPHLNISMRTINHTYRQPFPL